MTKGWDRPLKLHELAHGALTLELAPDEAERAAAARRLGLLSLPSLKATVTVRPWLDGVALEGAFEAVVEQQCGVSLEPFEQPVEGVIEASAVPPGSPHAAEPEGGEMSFDLDAPDPPDVLESEAVDVAAYVVEHLALALDPFPRKPGARFDYEGPAEETSPFAVLKNLKPPKP